jgi:hypothetical protein
MKALRYPSTYIYAPYASAAGMLLNKNRKVTAVNRNSPLSEKDSFSRALLSTSMCRLSMRHT